jgi:hypothetical protein
MLPKEAIEEYKRLYEKRFGVLLSDAEASFRANNLVNLYRATLGSESSEIKRTGNCSTTGHDKN